VRLRLPLTRAEDLMRAVPGSITEEALEAARVTGETMEIELPMENTEVAVSQLITVPDLTVVAPMPLRRGLHAHARAAAERDRGAVRTRRGRDRGLAADVARAAAACGSH